LTRRWHPQGQDGDVDTFLDAIRTSLDQPAEVLRDQRTTTWMTITRALCMSMTTRSQTLRL
jgi:hypothetical protein